MESRGNIYVTLKSASDESSGRAGHAARRTRASRMRSLMQRHLERSQGVTVVASDSESMADPYAIDLTMRRLSRVERGPHVEVECEIRVAVSTREGKMLSVLTGGAKVQVPRDTFRDEFMPRLRREALEGAVRSVHRDLLAYLAKLP
jgi:hypothetical protein